MAVLVLAVIVLLVILAAVGWALWMIISAAIVGAIIGGLARLVIPGRQAIGIFATIVIGWVGSLIGSLLGRRVFHVGSVLTVLCEIGVAAILVALASSGAGTRSREPEPQPSVVSVTTQPTPRARAAAPRRVPPPVAHPRRRSGGR